MTKLITLYILRRILRIAVSTPSQNMHEWKKKLGLLRICSAWSKIMLYAVYSSLYLSAKRNKKTGTISMDTNLDLIIQRQCTDIVQSVIIDYGTSNVCCTTARVTDTLKRSEECWPGVQSIYFRDLLMKNNERRCMCMENNMERQFSKDLAVCFNNLFRNAFRICFGTWLPDNGLSQRYVFSSTKDFTDALQSDLLDIYNQKVTHVTGMCIFDLVELERFPENLTTLVLRFANNNHDYTFPEIICQRLQYLCLENVSEKFRWDSFLCDNRLVYFENLKDFKLSYIRYFKIDYYSDSWIVDRDFEQMPGFIFMEFPRLEILEIENCPGDCCVLYSRAMPKLKSLKLSCAFSSLTLLQKMDFGYSVTMDLCIYETNGFYYIDSLGYQTSNNVVNIDDFFSIEQDIFSQTISHILSYANGSTSSLKIDQYFSPSPGFVKWGYINQLTLDCEVHMADLLVLLWDAPMLRHLHIYRLSSKIIDVPLVYLGRYNYKTDNGRVFETSLQKINIVCLKDSVLFDIHSRFIVGLLVNIPSITHVGLNDEFLYSFVKYTSKLLKRFPRLANILLAVSR